MDRQESNVTTSFLAGARIRALRRQMRMSIKVFAEKTDISPGHVSLIERNMVEPSLTVLRRISEVLQVTVPTLLVAEDVSELMVVRNDENRFTFPDGAGIYHFRTPAALKSGRVPQLTMVTASIEARHWDHIEPVTHDGDEYVNVLQGCIEYHTTDRAIYAGTGDSLYIKSGTPHRVFNPSNHPAEILVVFNAPFKLNRKIKSLE